MNFGQFCLVASQDASWENAHLALVPNTHKSLLQVGWDTQQIIIFLFFCGTLTFKNSQVHHFNLYQIKYTVHYW